MRSVIVNVDNNTFAKIQMIALNMGVSVGDFMKEILNTPVFKETLNMMWLAVVKTNDIENESARKDALIKELKELAKQQTNDKK